MIAVAATTIDFDTLYREQRDRVFWTARRRLQNWADAEDITQDAFLKALERRNEYRGDAPPSVWLASIAKWETLTYLGERSRFVAAGDWLEQFADELPDTPIEPTDGPCVADPEVAERVRAALAAMPPTVRTAVDLYCLRGMSRREVAERMGTTVKAVSVLIYRALHDVNLSGPEWRDLVAERGLDSPEAELFRTNPQLLRLLSPQQREAVRLRFLERLPVPEVALRMKTTRRRVSSTLHKARSAVRALSAALQPVGAR